MCKTHVELSLSTILTCAYARARDTMTFWLFLGIIMLSPKTPRPKPFLYWLCTERENRTVNTAALTSFVTTLAVSSASRLPCVIKKFKYFLQIKKIHISFSKYGSVLVSDVDFQRHTYCSFNKLNSQNFKTYLLLITVLCNTA